MPGPRLVSRPWLGGSFKFTSLRRVSFKPNRYQFGSCHVQGHQDKQKVSFGNLLIISRSRPPKWPTGYHAGIVSDPRPPKNSPKSFSTISFRTASFGNGFHFGLVSSRNGFGIILRGPMGPSPPRAPKAPLGPLGSPWVPWVPWPPLPPFPLGPLGPLGSLGGVGVGVGPLGCLWVQGIGTL